MCEAMGAMIDRTEAKYGCITRKLCTDNDGGTEAGRNLLAEQRPWLRVAPEPWTCALCLVGNQTRWTTHTLAFKRLLDLKETMRGTVLRNHEGGQPLE